MTMKHFRIILAAGAAVAALAICAPIAAHPEHRTTENVRETKTVTKDGDQTIEVHKIVKGDGKETDVSTMVSDCGGGRRFESAAQTGEGDKKSVNKIVLCADKGESQAQWDKALRDALARLEANTDMPSEGKAKIMADLRNEIARNGK
jgi:hypothetical protein